MISSIDVIVYNTKKYIFKKPYLQTTEFDRKKPGSLSTIN